MTKNNLELSSSIEELGPWHLVVDVRDGITTQIENQKHTDGRMISQVDGKVVFDQLIGKLYPDGLAGKSFFDNACNCGGYSFWAKEMGADHTFGYDAREHWIRQAEFLRENRAANTENMVFKVADLYDIPKMDLPVYDITWFSGIFYHLPDPVSGLKIAADRTGELFYLNTAILTATEEEIGDGCLYITKEGVDHLMTGVHGMAWFPSGPKVLTRLLNWVGFPEVRILRWTKRVTKDARPSRLRRDVGRISLVAARTPGMLAGIKDAEVEERREHKWRKQA